MDAGLRSGVGGEVLAFAVQAGRAPGEDDRPAARGEHRPHGVLDREKGAGQVDVDRATPHVEIEISGPGILPEQLHTGIRHHHVRTPAGGDEVSEGSLDGCLVGNVDDGRTSSIADVGGDGCRGIRISVSDDHSGALASEPLRDRASDAGSGARDERRLASQPGHLSARSRRGAACGRGSCRARRRGRSSSSRP